MKTRPPMTTRWPESGSPEVFADRPPAPRPTMTNAAFGGTRRMRLAMKPAIATATMTNAMTAMTVMLLVMKSIELGSCRSGVADQGGKG